MRKRKISLPNLTWWSIIPYSCLRAALSPHVIAEMNSFDSNKVAHPPNVVLVSRYRLDRLLDSLTPYNKSSRCTGCLCVMRAWCIKKKKKHFCPYLLVQVYLLVLVLKGSDGRSTGIYLNQQIEVPHVNYNFTIFSYKI